jgi:hypothetical protein
LRASAPQRAAGCVVFAALSLERSFVFRDTDSLFADAADKQPRSFFAHYCLTRTRLFHSERTADPAEARRLLESAAQHAEQMRQAVDQERQASPACVLMLEAHLALRLGKPEARARLEELADRWPLRPNEQSLRPLADWFLAELASEEYRRDRQKERLEEIVRRAGRALQDRPDWDQARYLRAEALEGLGRAAEARAEYGVLLDDPDYGPRALAALQRLTDK